MISLVAFLGNYGKQYAGNRHNVAWQFADSLPFAGSLSWQKKFKAQYASSQFDSPGASGERSLVHFIKPETFMNLSGESIEAACAFFKLKPENVLVVHDELELPLGVVSLKWSGGLGGHNGLRSTKASLGTPDFWRLRFGIGRPEHPDVAAYVLSDFSSDERITLGLVWPQASSLLDGIIREGPEPFVKEWGKKRVVEI
ncbi:MAG TPA: aminoacyl-tRNA hydrolase [Treponemataceae bacterium]|nr:aminoacyl-tRNA hydrolase [Treponemataceae bacterium]HPS43174.1 aminoacyl-tRNA hydrolase [Treponemataceae bacterium]